MMRNILIFALCLVLLLCAVSCGRTEPEEEPFSAAFTIRQQQAPTEVFFDTSYTGETHVLRDDALDYDALRDLFIDGLFGEEAETAARWNTSVRYALEGEFTTQDAQVASEFAMELARINGFPGIRETTAADANVHIRFVNADRSQFAYHTDASGSIRSVEITVPAAYLPAQRSAAVRQHLMRGCGFFYTAETALDSVLAQRPASDLSDADIILLNILYGCVEAGDSRDACLAAFGQYFA